MEIKPKFHIVIESSSFRFKIDKDVHITTPVGLAARIGTEHCEPSDSIALAQRLSVRSNSLSDRQEVFDLLVHIWNYTASGEVYSWGKVTRVKTLTIQVPDEVYAVCERMAARTGRTVEACVMEFLLKYGPRPAPVLSEEERRQAMERLLRHAGAQSLGRATGIDNEGIDADLAREYLDTHEEVP